MLPVLMAAAVAGPSHGGGAGRAPGRPPDSHNLPPPRGGDVVVEADRGPGNTQPYAPPRPGARYRALAAGERLCRDFLATRYVVSDPARFDLPPAASGQQWIRYWGDLLLVDRATRKVVRAITGSDR
jgi:Ni/Co efflux regulator RcnB